MIFGRGNMKIVYGLLPKIALAAATVAAGVILYISWQHNPQCEIHCDGEVYWGYWLMLGLSAFVPVYIFVLLLGLLVQRVNHT